MSSMNKIVENTKKLNATLVCNFKHGLREASSWAVTCKVKASVVANELLGASLIRCKQALHKADAAFTEIYPVVIKQTKTTCTSIANKANVALSTIENRFGKVHFNFQHFVLTTTTAALVFAVTFTFTGLGRSQVDAATVLRKVEVATPLNEKAIKVNYGDDSAIIDVAKEIISRNESNVYDAKAITLNDGSQGYEIGNYVVKLDRIPTKELREDTVAIKIQSKEAYASDSVNKVELNNDKPVIADDVFAVNSYLVNVKYVDTQAPVIALSETHVDVLDTGDFDPQAYVTGVFDNYDEVVNYTVSGEIEENEDGLYIDGDYTFTYTAVDANGNKAEAQLVVTVSEDEEAAKERREAELEEERQANQSAETANEQNVTQAPTPAANAARGGGIATAISLVGSPYVYGGTSPAGFDCSGFVQYSFGIGARTTGAQAALGQHYYDVQNAPAGALLFWGGDSSPYHVAISLGNGSYVHAGTPATGVTYGSQGSYRPNFYIVI
ncbi:cell wall-associated NlpC family hydrolase [Breznakia blatticola]|uniref:Cell wall-associated NlpC family hydrolase n=1 Tax=Breznakia blatticola TaxID=1754012 RepID=A0A4R7Z8F5_9FIRM|nr:C40 family peptidase [Breznakia blatticola]TDW08935.1 cell wall-associated NlpC family hydrolase [Breznakia blatticola]